MLRRGQVDGALEDSMACSAPIELQGFCGQKGGTIGTTRNIFMAAIEPRPLGSRGLTQQASKKRYAALGNGDHSRS